jgi:7-carboxy-7-deazaguanine synthase
MSELVVCEIFKSIQGESSITGYPCSFVRLASCNLSCNWCDTRYALSDGVPMSSEEIIESVKKHGTRIVEITGGEPLLQEATPQLCRSFLDSGFTVLVETNGSQDISVLPDGCRRIVDVKCPSSGMAGSFLESNLFFLTGNDELKYVISDKHDFDWAVVHLLSRNLADRHRIIFSPNTGSLSPAELASWILESSVPVVLGLQLHKIIWGDRRGV